MAGSLENLLADLHERQVDQVPQVLSEEKVDSLEKDSQADTRQTG